MPETLGPAESTTISTGILVYTRDDLFPKANLGWGPHVCFPYSYESFVIAARYFPRFGTEAGIDYTAEQNYRRDLGRFEGGPVSSLLAAPSHGSQPTDGVECNQAGRFNYGMFGNWLHTQNIMVDLLKIVTGNWNAGAQNTAAGFGGPIFGPTSLIINNECNGEDKIVPGGGGENRRIKAFKWFTSYFNVPADMPEHFVSQQNYLSYQPEWSTTWKENKSCECAPAGYSGNFKNRIENLIISGMIHYYTPGHYPEEFVKLNDANREFCQHTIYERPDLYNMNSNTSACLKTPL
ncbi:Chitinase class I [Aphelenchoides besseyi]|nr:Chitinase class I [Aphelenchoides besseyi]